METLDWSLIYHNTIGEVMEMNLYWFQGICLFSSLALFVLIIVFCLRSDTLLEKNLKENTPDPWLTPGGDLNERKKRAPGKYLILSLKMTLFCISLIWGMMILLCIYRMTSPRFSLFYLVPPAIGTFLFKKYYKRYTPDREALETLLPPEKGNKKRVKGLTAIHFDRSLGCLLFPVIFFSFVAIHGGLSAYGLSMLVNRFHSPRVIAGIVRGRTDLGHRRVSLDLEISKAWHLTPQGLSEAADIPSPYSPEVDLFSLPEGIKRGDSIVAIETFGTIIEFIDIPKSGDREKIERRFQKPH